MSDVAVTARTLVLVVDDEEPIRRFLATTLAARGYAVELAATLAAGRLLCTAHPPDLLLLDLGLPDGDGIELVHEVRAWSRLPIVVLSARGQEASKVQALDAGADDYLTKPFGVPELLARLRAALRRAVRPEGGESATVILPGERGDLLRLDLVARRCRLQRDGVDCDVALTRTEFRLLAALAQHSGKVMTHTHLLRLVWGPGHDGDVAYLRVYMGQLRHKLEADPAQPRWLVTEPGVGYRLETGES